MSESLWCYTMSTLVSFLDLAATYFTVEIAIIIAYVARILSNFVYRL
jgi:hypothetical protein